MRKSFLLLAQDYPEAVEDAEAGETFFVRL